MRNGRSVLPSTLPVPDSAVLGSCWLRSQQLGGCVIVRLGGEIDLSNSAALRRHLSTLADVAHVVVDLSRVGFLDSTALGALIAARQRADARGTTIHLAGACGIALRVLQITGLDVHLDHYDNVADGVGAALAIRDGTSGRKAPGRRRTVRTRTEMDDPPHVGHTRPLADDGTGTVEPVEGAAG
jgi:anti-sigma B factor antagonist